MSEKPEDDPVWWAPVPLAASVAGRSHRSVRTWVREGLVRCSRDPRRGLLVHVRDVLRESGTRRRNLHH